MTNSKVYTRGRAPRTVFAWLLNGGKGKGRGWRGNTSLSVDWRLQDCPSLARVGRRKRLPHKAGVGRRKRLPHKAGVGRRKRLPHKAGVGRRKRLPHKVGVGRRKRLPHKVGVGRRKRLPHKVGIEKRGNLGLALLAAGASRTYHRAFPAATGLSGTSVALGSLAGNPVPSDSCIGRRAYPPLLLNHHALRYPTIPALKNRTGNRSRPVLETGEDHTRVGCYEASSKVSRRGHLSVTSVRLHGSGSSIPT